MNFVAIAIFTIICSLALYIIFLVLGVGGIPKNRKAQGIDKQSKNLH